MQTPLRRQAGFTLLEAVVAIVLVATSGMALFSWVNSSLMALERVSENNARSAATQNALEYMAAVNPMLRPNGRTSLDGYDLSWQAATVQPPHDGVNYPYGLGLWQFALYDTRVSLTKPDGATWFDFQIRQIGYKRVRSVEF